MADADVDTSAAAVERLAQERDEKAAESFMFADAHRMADRDGSGWFLAGQHAAQIAATLRALLSERDAAQAAAANARRAAIEEAAATLDRWPIYIEDTTAPGVMQRDARIAAAIRALAGEAAQ